LLRRWHARPCTPEANTYCVTSTADTDDSTFDNSAPRTLRQATKAANAVRRRQDHWLRDSRHPSSFTND
jgi:hypothetical protein